MKLRIFVTLKTGVLDPQGRAIQHALGSLGFDGVADLDSARLVHALDGLPIEHTGIEVHYQHGVDHIVSAVNTGRADAGILIRPATVAQIEANAHSGNRMPPKTTFFHPKPKTGIVFRSLD